MLAGHSSSIHGMCLSGRPDKHGEGPIVGNAQKSSCYSSMVYMCSSLNKPCVFSDPWLPLPPNCFVFKLVHTMPRWLLFKVFFFFFWLKIFLFIFFSQTIYPDRSFPSLHSSQFCSHFPFPEIYCSSIDLQKRKGLPGISTGPSLIQHDKMQSD